MNGSETWITCLHVLEIGQYSIRLYKIPPESVRNRPSVSASSHNGCYSRFWSELDRLGVGKSCLPSERRRRRRRGGGEQTSVGDSIFFSAGAATFFCLTELSLSLLSLSVSVAAFYLLSQLFFSPLTAFKFLAALSLSLSLFLFFYLELYLFIYLSNSLFPTALSLSNIK